MIQKTTPGIFIVAISLLYTQIRPAHVSNEAALAAMRAREAYAQRGLSPDAQLAALAAGMMTSNARTINPALTANREIAERERRLSEIRATADRLWAQERAIPARQTEEGRPHHFVYSEFENAVSSAGIQIPYLDFIEAHPEYLGRQNSYNIFISVLDFVLRNSAFIQGHDYVGRPFISIAYTIKIVPHDNPASSRQAHADQDSLIHITTYFLRYTKCSPVPWAVADNNCFGIFSQPENSFLDLAQLITQGQLMRTYDRNSYHVKLATIDELRQQGEQDAKLRH